MNTDHYILDENHELVEIEVWHDRCMDQAALLRWGQWMETPTNRRVAFDQIGPFDVSTVFLGLCHQWNPDRAPLLFETLVFDREHTVEGFGGKRHAAIDETMTRYSTWEQAKAGHAAMLERMRVWLSDASAAVEEHAAAES